MPPRLCSLEITDWMPFAGTHRVEFGPGPILVRGPNGAGKSALLAALAWAHTGWHPEATLDDLVHADTPWTEVVVTHDDGTVVSRRRERGGRTVRKFAGTDAASGKAAERSAEEYLGLDARTYTSLVHVRQGEVVRLATADNSERRDILFRWVAAEAARWERFRAEARERRRVAARELDRARAAVAALETSVAVPDGEPEGVAVLDAEMAAMLRERDAARLVAERDAAAAALAELPQPPPVPDGCDPAVRADANDRLGRARAGRDAASRVAAGRFDGACPLTGSACPAAETVVAMRGAAAAEAARHRADADAAAAEIAAMDAADSRRRAAISAAERVVSERERLQKRVAALAGAVARPMADIDDAISELQRRRSRAAALAEAHAAAARAAAALSAAKTDAERAEVDAAAAAAVVAAVDGVAGPAALARAAVEEVANDLLVDSGLSVRLAWTRTTTNPASECGCGATFRGKSATCGSCGAVRGFAEVPDLTILVDDGRVERDVRYRSGGVQQVVCLALRLAAATGSPVGWLVLDEVDAALSDDWCRTVATMLRRAAARGLQLVVVSHRAATAAAAAAVVDVVADGPSSRTVTT